MYMHVPKFICNILCVNFGSDPYQFYWIVGIHVHVYATTLCIKATNSNEPVNISQLLVSIVMFQ